MSTDDEEFQEFLEIFQEESLERLVACSRALEALPSAGPGERPGLMDEIDRELHTIKGSARLLGFSQLGSLVHDVEGLARAVRERPQLGIDLLVEATDRLASLVEEAAASGEDVGDAALLARVQAGCAPDAAPAAPAPRPAGRDPAPPAPAAAGSGAVDPERPTRSYSLGGAAPPDEGSDEAAGLPGEASAAPPAAPPELGTTTRIGAEARGEASGRGRGDDEVVRVRASRLKELDEAVSDLTLARQRLETFETRLRTLLRGVEDASSSAGDVAQALRRMLHDFRADTLQVQNATGTLQRLAVDVRLRQVSFLFDHIPREARALARRLGKKVRLQVRGEETEMDRVILDALKSPLTHLLRNALDHGIEAPAERLAAGKPPEGLLEVSAGQEGNRVVIRVEDDGAGIDPARVRRTAVTRGVLDESMAAQMSDYDAIQLIFAPGFSTRTTATEISGRGVGMDAVRRVVEDLKGDVQVSSDTGAGSTITIRLPLTLLISRVMLLRSGGQRFALPTESIEESLRLRAERIATFSGHATVLWRGQTIPLLRLSAFLEQPVLPDAEHLRVLVVHHAGERLGLVVEELLEERAVVVKPLGWPLELLPWINGAVHTPSGEIALQLHVPEVFAGLRTVEALTGERSADATRSILVVDDSIVSRQLLGRAVEAIGFQPLIAVDGLDAWGILERVRPQLIVTDIEMPRLDGLQLARRVRGNARLAGVPIIIVSNRGSSEDRQAGLEAGADGYLTKSEFNHNAFRSLVERML